MIAPQPSLPIETPLPFPLELARFRLDRFAGSPARLLVVSDSLRVYVQFLTVHGLDGARCIHVRTIAQAEGDPRHSMPGSRIVFVAGVAS